jgi:uncharacterized protein (TIRG00374 family)
MSLASLRGKLIPSVILGVLVVLALAFLGDMREVGTSFSTFQWIYIPAILGFTLLNYVLRWDYYLHRLAVHSKVNYLDSALMFTAGMVMAVTPGKIGEVFKSYLLKRVNNTPITTSAPIVLAERLTDGLAMLLLMALGLTLYPPARLAFIVLLLGSIVGIVLLQFRPFVEWVIALIERLPLGAKIAPRLRDIYESTLQLMGWKVILISTLISFVSWGFECLAFYYVLVALGIEGTGLLLLQATFIFAASTLFGLVSFLPGGLGASEASSAGLLVFLVGMSNGAASAATLIIRFCTLWFGVLLGIVALVWFSRRYRGELGQEEIA